MSLEQQSFRKEEGFLRRLLANATRLRQRIQLRLEGKTLPPPEEVIVQMREEDLLSSYQQLGQDESREAEALEWAEALISDVSSEKE